MPRCRNITLKDGVAASRTGLVFFSPNPGNDPWQTINPDLNRLGFYHHQDFENGNKRFWHFGINNAATDKVTTHYYDSGNTRWTNAVCAGTVADATHDYWFNVCEVVNDANADGTPDTDAEFLILNVTPTDSSITSGSIIQQYNTDVGSGQFTSISGNHKCKRVLFYNGRLVLLGTNSYEIKWSEQWDHDDILSTEAFNFFYAYGTGGAILNGELLKGEIILFKEDSIWSGYKISATPFLRWEPAYPDVGLMTSRQLAKFGQVLFFVGNNNIYAYAGGSEIYPIGTPVWSQFLSDMRDGGVSATQLYKDRGFASVHRDTGEIAFWIVTGNAEWPNVAYVYNVHQRSWVKWVLPGKTDSSPTHCLSVTGWGEYEHDTTITDANFIPFYTCAQSQLAGGTTVDNLRCAKFDYTTRTDMKPDFAEAGTAGTRPINSWAETKDFVRTLVDNTDWVDFVVEGRGFGTTPSLTIEISTDGGLTYSKSESVTLQTTYDDTVKANFNITGHKARFKMSMNSSAKGFSVRAYEIVPSSPESDEA